MKKQKIETKKDEIRYMTDDPKKMLNKYVGANVIRRWAEEFTDEDTGHTVSVDREETLFYRGTLIDQDVLQEINFWMQEGSIKEIEVSNQKRMAFELQSTYLNPWMVQVEIENKKHKILAYASSVGNVMEIMDDYLELHYTKGYSITMVKEMESCVILTDNMARKKDDETDEVAEKKFYQLEVKVTYSDDVENTQDYIIHAYDTDRAIMCISHFLKEWEKKKEQEHIEKGWSEWKPREFKLIIEKAAPIPVGVFVPKEFTMAYNAKK